MSRFYIEVDSENNPIGNPVDENSARSIGYFQDGFRDGSIPDRYVPFLLTREIPKLWNEAWAAYGELRYEDGYWFKAYEARDMTAEELSAYQAEVEADWAAAHPTWTSWTFNNESGVMSPPVHPAPGMQNPQWDEATQTWSEGPAL